MHPNMIWQQIHPKRTTLSLIALAFTAMTLIPASTFAAPLLRCKIEQSGVTFQTETSPQRNPYDVAAIAINKNFRFKAVVIGDEQKIDYIKIYAYYQGDRQAILLHEAKYLTPSAQTAQSAELAPYQLTGKHYLYSPNLNREMQYGCSLIENIKSAAK
jgi:hypothetical protein